MIGSNVAQTQDQSGTPVIVRRQMGHKVMSFAVLKKLVSTVLSGSKNANQNPLDDLLDSFIQSVERSIESPNNPIDDLVNRHRHVTCTRRKYMS